MSARKECPFCGNLHVKVETLKKGTFVLCPRCKCRGPLYEHPSDKTSAWNANEAVARWDNRSVPA